MARILGRLAWLVLWLCLQANVGHAQLTLRYPDEPNGGSTTRSDRTLSRFSVEITTAASGLFPSSVQIVRQDGKIPTGVPASISCTATGLKVFAFPADLPNVLWEGRNQVLGQATGADGVTLSNIPSTFVNPTSNPPALFIDVNTGPPNNPQATTFSTAGEVRTTDAYQTRVLFNSSTATPLTLTIGGTVLNRPNSGVPQPEVYARLTSSIAAYAYSSSISPLPSTVTTYTVPITVPFTALPAVSAETPGTYTLPTLDFTSVRDGIYQLKMKATDVANQESPGTTSTIIMVDVDRTAPIVTVTYPTTATLVIDGTTPPSGVVGDSWVLQGLVTDERRQATTVSFSAVDRALITTGLTTVQSTAGTGRYFRAMDFQPGHGIVPTTPPLQDAWRLDLQSRDLAGNESAIRRIYIIRDTAPPLAPTITYPTTGTGVSSSALTVQGTVLNVRTGLEDYEEHGRIRIALTLTSTVNPSITAATEFEANALTTRHTSSLNDPSGFTIPAGAIGSIPDGFTFRQTLNMTGFPHGTVQAVAVAIDEVGNRSDPSSPVLFTYGKGGPQVTLDFEHSGPDDNYQLMGSRTNQYGSDDGDSDGFQGFYISLKSPERYDVGIPPSTPRPPLFNGRNDPGDAGHMIVSGVATDISTPVASVTAFGNYIQTTTVTPTTPAATVQFSIAVDVRRLPEGTPVLVNVRATDSSGLTGATTSITVFRDVIPGRAPRITFPPLLQIPYGSGYLPSFFAGTNPQAIEGVAEPYALVVVSTPVTTGTISPPIPRTTSLQVANRMSALSSFPAGAQFVRADSSGKFRFPSVDLSRVATSATTPVPIIIQTVDSFDNTDPVTSVTPIGVFRLDRPGQVTQVRLDPHARNYSIYPNTPVQPVVQQFFTHEKVRIQVTYNTLIDRAPLLTVQQTGTVAAAAQLVAPIGATPLTTQVLIYQYEIPPVSESFDGSVIISITGGMDLFGFIPDPFHLSRGFFVDTLAPQTVTVSPTAFFPPTGGQVSAITTVSVSVIDRPATNGSAESSCLSTVFSSFRLRGPLETSPDQEIALIEPAPPFVSQPVTVPPVPVTMTRVPVSPVTEEGTYEIRADVGDNVGNVSHQISLFTLDRTPITTSRIVCRPADRSYVTTLPLHGTRQAAFVTVLDGNVDLNRSNALLLNPNRSSIGLTPISTGSDTLVVRLANPLPGAGRSDGLYFIESDIFDKAGNPSPRCTCSFTLDTLPPWILSLFPFDRGCGGPPLREVHAELADGIPDNGYPPAFSGVDLSQAKIKVRLWVPDSTNHTLAGSEVKSVKKYRTVTGPYDLLAVEFVDQAGATRALRSDGSEDGQYRVEVTAVDRAGNTTEAVATFNYDSQPPNVTLTQFPEGSFLADSIIVMGGGAFDLGPCGLPRNVSPSAVSTEAVQVSIRRLDASGKEVYPVLTPFFDFRNVTAIGTKSQPDPFVKDDSEWGFVGTIPSVPGRARVLVRVFDRAGNSRTITREITIQTETLRPPSLVSPKQGAVTASKAVVFEWKPVTQAKVYDLELTRVNPTNLTTTTTFFGVEYPSNEYLPVTVNGKQRPLNLSDFVSVVTNGSPITTASTFSWKVRSSDVSLNAGAYSTPSTFVVDPTPPGVADVSFEGVTASPIATVGSGTTNVTVTFAEDCGMDPDSPIEVTCQPRDLAVPPILLRQTSFDRFTWTGTLTISPSTDAIDVNGRARLVIRSARNLANTLLAEVQVPFDIDIGPFFHARFFSNPAIPEELEIILKATANSGTTTPIPLLTPPQATITQHGHFNPAPLLVWPVTGLTVTNSAFRTSFRVDKNLIGCLDFKIVGTKTNGVSTTRAFGVTVAGELAVGGVNFPLVTRYVTATLPDGALPSGSPMVAVPSSMGPETVVSALQSRALQLGLLPAGTVGYLFPDTRELTSPLSIRVPLSKVDLRAGVKASQVGIYRGVVSGSSAEFEWLGGAEASGDLVASTRKLGYLTLLADQSPPVIDSLEPTEGEAVSEPTPVIKARVRDSGSGIDPHTLKVVIDNVEHPGTFDASTQSLTYSPESPLRAGTHEVKVQVSDRAGNIAKAQSSMTVAGPISVTQAIAVPNPVRFAPARIRYMLSTAARSVRIRIYDVSGRLVQSLEGPGMTGANIVDWELENRTGLKVANGVYFFTLEAIDYRESKAKSRGKIAVIR